MKIVSRLLISLFVVFSFCYADTNEYNQIGRYMISAGGDFIIDTKTGVVKRNNSIEMSKKFYQKDGR
ncbi:hypothetical protein [Francisella sp. 19X1-34]|uniref:hypothetical protein n=1 Tax=Francisella sp. 19X1-34 TaxID=3087177 RepID=UPI002E32644D|nr:hypothetical protein [Francisella sp. 19X1-34]MED7787940.1 hypothetical protein [Francisella sp. 19X1-34]